MNKPLKALYLSERPLSRNEAHMCVEQPVVDRVLLQQEMESFGFTLYEIKLWKNSRSHTFLPSER